MDAQRDYKPEYRKLQAADTYHQEGTLLACVKPCVHPQYQREAQLHGASSTPLDMWVQWSEPGLGKVRLGATPGFGEMHFHKDDSEAVWGTELSITVETWLPPTGATAEPTSPSVGGFFGYFICLTWKKKKETG